MKIFDQSQTGQLTWEAFCRLFSWLEQTSHHFCLADKDHGGSLDLAEVPAALVACGFQLSPFTTQKYLQKHSYGRGQLTFAQFLALVCEIQQVRAYFSWVDTDRDGKIDFDQALSLSFDMVSLALAQAQQPALAGYGYGHPAPK